LRSSDIASTYDKSTPRSSRASHITIFEQPGQNLGINR
jgi:hypothetical protein